MYYIFYIIITQSTNLSDNFFLVFQPDSISRREFLLSTDLPKIVLTFDRFEVTYTSADILCLKKAYDYNFGLDGILPLDSKFIKSCK